jgi:hypothetical protein
MSWHHGMASRMTWPGSWMEHMDRMVKESMSNHFFIDDFLKQAQDYSNSKIRQAARLLPLPASPSHPSLDQSSRTTVLGRSQSQFSMELISRTQSL